MIANLRSKELLLVLCGCISLLPLANCLPLDLFLQTGFQKAPVIAFSRLQERGFAGYDLSFLKDLEELPHTSIATYSSQDDTDKTRKWKKITKARQQLRQTQSNGCTSDNISLCMPQGQKDQDFVGP